MKNLINFIKENVYKKTGVNLELRNNFNFIKMKKKILILAGGYSKERDISIKTAKAVYKQIKNDLYVKYLIQKKVLLKK